jgi:hypothetical protein
VVIGDLAGVWQAIHALPNFHICMSIVDFVGEFVGGRDAGWEMTHGDAHVFVIFHGHV